MRPKGDKARQAPTIRQVFFEYLARLHGRISVDCWPNPKYRHDPVGFVKNVLQEAIILPHQAEILESICKNPKTAVRSGQKTGKTKLLVWAALWWYCCVPEGKVVMTAAIADQIRAVIWNELTRTVAKARKKGLEIEDASPSPATGMQAPDGRIIYGFTARNKEAIAGISAAGGILFLIDEASALEQEYAEAFEGNAAGGGCSILYISNPTRTEGPFYDAFHAQKAFWSLFHLSSEAIAIACENAGIKVPGVANAEVIRGWEQQYGRDSPFFLMRVLGEFIAKESGRIIGVGDIVSAVQRWETSEGVGVLSIGVDPAGPGDFGDEWAFAVTRGDKCLAIIRARGLTEEQGLARLEGVLKEYRVGEETPRVNVDSEGSIGAAFYGRCRALSEHHRLRSPKLGFDVYGIKASNPAARQPREYVKLRDELWANLGQWMKGGAIPGDVNLEAELHAPFFIGVSGGKVSATPKRVLRDKLGRSPDSADALGLSVWNPTPWAHEEEDAGKPEPPRETTLPDDWGRSEGRGGGDIYGGGGIDPYST